MNINGVIRRADLSGKLLFQPSVLCALPNVAEASDSFSIIGSGAGAGCLCIRTCIGEYFERRHFYREVISTQHGRLSESLTPVEIDCFGTAFVQTATKKISKRQVAEHKFRLSQVIRSTDFSTCFIPTICISLSSSHLRDDEFIYPLRDTCGCSFHWRTDDAILGALKEYLERQFLLRFWLTKRCRTLMSGVQVDKILNKKNIKLLYDLLVVSGELSILDISDSAFPGVCILVVYGQAKIGHHVNYCAGMSYAATASDALEKALLELWQTYRFMDLFKAIDSEQSRVEDPYLRHFLSCNAYEVYQDITDVVTDANKKLVMSDEEFSAAVLLSVLNNKNISGYFYLKKSSIEGVGCMFCKFVSPDFFLHMNNSQSLNVFNKYSQDFYGAIVASRLSKMVPFP